MVLFIQFIIKKQENVSNVNQDIIKMKKVNVLAVKLQIVYHVVRIKLLVNNVIFTMDINWKMENVNFLMIIL